MNQAANIKHLLGEMLDKVTEGEEIPLTVYGEMKQIQETLTNYMGTVHEEIIYYMDNQGEKTMTDNGFKFTKVKGRTSYSFKGIQPWEEKVLAVKAATAAQKVVQEQYKEAYKMTQKGLVAVDPATGEIVEFPDGFVVEGQETLRVSVDANFDGPK